MTDPLVDRDEYGQPVSDRYRRLGAGAGEEGMYVRFEPGFGLNVHIGWRRVRPRWTGDQATMGDNEMCVMGILGWESLCSLVDEWRHREGPL